MICKIEVQLTGTFPRMCFHMNVMVAFFCLLSCASTLQEAPSLSPYLLKSFQCNSNETFNHFTVSDDGQVYAAAVDALYYLSQNFEIQSQVKFQSEPQPNINKILEIVPEPVNQLISCGTGFNGNCQLRNLGNVTDIERNLSHITIAPGSDSTVGLVVTRSENHSISLELYIGQTVRREDYLLRRPISSVCLYKEGSEGCRENDNRGINAIGYYTAFNFYIKYAHVFTYKGYTYYLTSQRADATNPDSPVVPKLSRVCHNDESRDLAGFTEVTLDCKGKNSTIYSIAQSAQEINGQLFIVLAMNNPEYGSDFNPANQSALCVYEMDYLVTEFADSAINCTFRCDGSPCSYSTYLSFSRCEDHYIANDEFYSRFVCSPPGLFRSRYPERSPSLGAISGLVVFEERGFSFSSIVISQIYQPHTQYVAFIGTSEGHLLKMRFQPYNTSILYEVVTTPHSILSDTLLSGDNESLIILTEKELLKLTVANCSQFKTCEECIRPGSNLGDPYCGWCTLERRCTRYNMCSNSSVPERWLSFAAIECPHIKELEPRSLFARISSQAVVIKVAHLPSSGGYHYRCHFGDFTSVADFDGDTVTCQSPDTTYIPEIPEGENHIEVELAISSSAFSITIISTTFSFFDCSRIITGCTDCVTQWECDWCIDDLTCVYESENSCLNITDYSCVLTTREDEFITKASIGFSRSANNFTIRCSSMKYSYQDWSQETRANLSVKWQPENVQLDVSINVTLYKCHVGRPDCSRCLSNLTTRPELRCGWCEGLSGPSCSVRDICPRDLNFQCTDPPQLNLVWPVNSPIEGGTIVEIKGTDIGQRFSDINYLTLAGIKCNHSYFKERYKVGESVTCQAESSPTTRQGKIAIYVKDDLVAEGLVFTYTDPVIESFSPTFGPESGGSLINIRGSDLQTGSNVTAYVGEWPCYILKISSALIICKNSADQEEQSLSNITVTFDGYSRRAKTIFEYHQDPVITRVKPKKGIYSGGNKLTVTGQRLHLIQKPKITFTSNGKTVEEECTMVTSEKMVCLSPNLSLDQSTKREVEADGAVEVGFIMDGVTELLNWSRNVDVEFLIFRDPEYSMFANNIEDYDNVNGILIIEGKYVDLASSEDDVVVYIGNSSCSVISLQTDSVVCIPPLESPDPGDFNGNYQNKNLPFVVILHGNTRWNIGYLRYKSDLPEYFVPLVVVLVCLIFILLVGALSVVCVYRNKSTAVSQLKKKVKEVETNYYGEMIQLFTNLRDTAFDCEQKIQTLLCIPANRPDHYVINIIFEGENPVPPPQPHTDKVQTSTAALLEILRNERFLKILIHVLERKEISFNKKKRLASLLSLTMLLNDQQVLLIQILTELVVLKTETGNQDAKNFFKGETSVVEELLSNWIAVSYYNYLENVAKSILQVHGAIKYVCELGPIDAVSGKSQFSINDQNILQSQIEFMELKLEVLFKAENDQKVDMNFIDLDTITQVKTKILDHFYRGQPFSMRRPPNDFDLVWHCKDGGTIVRDDGMLKLDKGWKKLNTLADYKTFLGEGMCYFILTHEEIMEQQFYGAQTRWIIIEPNSYGRGDALATRGATKGGCYTTEVEVYDERPLLAITDGVNNENGCYVTEIQEYDDRPLTAATDDVKNSDCYVTKVQQYGVSGSKKLTRESEVYDEPGAGFSLWIWHLVKNEKMEGISCTVETEAHNTPSFSNEIVLSYLPATKNAIQKYVEEMFNELLSFNGNQIPVFIKMIFDIFDEQAVKIGRPKLARIWKNNVLPLGLWKSLIENPSLLHDVEDCNYVTECLVIISGIFADICSTNVTAIEELSPSKRLYAQDIPTYKSKLDQYYATIQSMAPVSEEILLAECKRTEMVFKESFDFNAILNRLTGIIQSYADEICIALNEDKDCRREDLAGKLQRIATMWDENERSVNQKECSP